jgi:hypothetical protein
MGETMKTIFFVFCYKKSFLDISSDILKIWLKSNSISIKKFGRFSDIPNKRIRMVISIQLIVFLVILISIPK